MLFELCPKNAATVANIAILFDIAALIDHDV